MIEEFNEIRTALPYLREFHKQLFVVKIGGEVFDNPNALEKVIEQISILYYVGIKLIVVHGGGKHATRLAEQLGVKTEFIDGRRVTSKEMLEVAKMSFAGTLNTDFLALSKKYKLPTVGLSGVDAGIIVAKKRAELKSNPGIDYGYVADCESVNTAPLTHLIEGSYVPVLCPLTSDNDGQLLNINADTLASQIAIALKAKKLCFIGSVEGVLKNVKDPSTLLSLLDVKEVQSLISDKIINGGMIPKLTTALEALAGGVERIHLCGCFSKDSLLKEIFTNEGAGTMIITKK